MPMLTLGLRLDEIGVSGSGTSTPTNCMLLTQHPTNANVIGYSSDFLNGGAEAYGTMVPNTTADGTLIYSYEIDHSTGVFVLKFGEDAVTQLNNVTDAVLYHNTDGAEGDILFVWDDINKWYSVTDLEKATNIKEYLGEIVCLSATAIPRVLIWYDFETMENDYVYKQVQIRYTSTDDLTTLDAYAIGGTAYITDNGDGTYDLWSDDDCEFVALSEDYYDSYDMNITKIEVIKGDTLKYFYYTAPFVEAGTFTFITNVTEIILDTIIKPDNTAHMFRECINLASLNLTYLDTSNVAEANNMFAWCSLLECITNLDTINATNKTDMFLNCTSLIQPDSTAQADLTDVDGADWVNASPCG